MKYLIAMVAFGIATACATLGPADRAEIATIASQIEVCQEVGRACKEDGGTSCYSKYDECMKAAGLH